AILKSGLLIVPDARADERFADNPLVTGAADIRFYAGAPLITPDGLALGALCVLDHVPRELTQQQQDALRVLSRQVLAQMELRRQTRELIATEAAASLSAAMSARVEREFRMLFAANPLAMWIYDKESMQFVEVNEAAISRYGYSRDEFLSMSIKDIRPPEDVGRLLQYIGGDREPWMDAGSWRHRVKSGRIIDVDITSHVLLFAGRPAVLVVAQDITDRKRAESERNEAIAALRVAEERIRYALQCANVGVWDMNYVTGELKWSEIQEANYGLAPGEFTGTYEAFLALVHPDDRDAVIAASRGAAISGGDFSIMHRAKWADGTVRWITGSGRADLNEHGVQVRAIGISMDITERRQLEEQYQQAQKMEAIGQLAGGVAHDFNNLLTVILGYCELLLTDLPEGDEHHHDLQEIQKAGTRAAGLTRQLLAFSRREIIAPTVIDLNEVVSDMKSMLQRLIGEDIKVQIRLRPGTLHVKADRGQLEQIVMNLAVNARDAMPNGGVLTLETSNALLDSNFHHSNFRTEPDPFVALTVKDNGTGMTPDVQARVFEPFFTTKAVGKGTGLGLATVHGIVKRAGGTVTIESELGRGTSIRVFLPIADNDDSLPEIHPNVRPHVGAETVLVVEDEDGLRELIRRLLLRQGYEVHVAANIDEAMQTFATIEADVLLTDVVMPGGSGPELTRKLVETHPGLRVLYMSGYTEDAIVHHGVLEPDIAFVHKPFTSESLSRKLREVLDR
ncbi:MAG: ATP-binding protein, partial [Gemmatimonadaceae bacterium]